MRNVFESYFVICPTRVIYHSSLCVSLFATDASRVDFLLSVAHSCRSLNRARERKTNRSKSQNDNELGDDLASSQVDRVASVCGAVLVSHGDWAYVLGVCNT